MCSFIYVWTMSIVWLWPRNRSCRIGYLPFGLWKPKGLNQLQFYGLNCTFFAFANSLYFRWMQSQSRLQLRMFVCADVPIGQRNTYTKWIRLLNCNPQHPNWWMGPKLFVSCTRARNTMYGSVQCWYESTLDGLENVKCWCIVWPVPNFIMFNTRM